MVVNPSSEPHPTRNRRSRVKFSYGTNAYTRFSLLESIPRIRQLGFEGIEILADDPHLNPVRITPQEAQRIVNECERHGLTMCNLNANTTICLDADRRDPNGFWPTLTDPSKDARQLKIQYVARCLDLAKTWRCPSITVSTGPIPSGLSREQAWGHFLDSLRRVLAHAEKVGVRVGIEYEPGFLVSEHRGVQDLIDRIGHPLLGLNLDLGHAEVAGEDIPAVIAQFDNKIWNIHVEDIRGRVHEHLIPGEGDIDFKAVRSALEGIRYDRFLSLELYPYKDNPDEAGRKGLEYLKRIF